MANFKQAEGRQISYNSLDYIRFVLILLVIVVHVVNFGELYPAVKDAINFFFMPAFLLITGYLFNALKTPREFGFYFMRLAMPYVIMVSGFAFLSLYLPVRGEKITLDMMPEILLVKSIGPYWFLHTMMVCGTLCYASFCLRQWLSPTACLCVFASLLIITVQSTTFLTATNAAFYFMGFAMRLGEMKFDQVFHPTLFALMPFALLMMTDYRGWGFLAILALACSFFCFVSALFSHCHGRVLWVSGYVGRNTFPVYIFHPIFTMAAKFLLPLFSFDASGLLHTAFTIALSVVGTLGLAYVLDKSHLSWCFGRFKLLR